MANYEITFKLEDTTFSIDEKLLPLLRFSLEYSIEFGKEVYTFSTLLEFNPKTKEFVFSEYALGKGFSYSNLLVEQLWNIHNPLKTEITQPEDQNHAGSWISYWNGAQGEKYEQKEKLNTFSSWWSTNFEAIKEEIIKRKEEYNQQIIDLFSRSLID
jgi:hypothetical protein